MGILNKKQIFKAGGKSKHNNFKNFKFLILYRNIKIQMDFN